MCLNWNTHCTRSIRPVHIFIWVQQSACWHELGVQSPPRCPSGSYTRKSGPVTRVGTTLAFGERRNLGGMQRFQKWSTLFAEAETMDRSYMADELRPARRRDRFMARVKLRKRWVGLGQLRRQSRSHGTWQSVW